MEGNKYETYITDERKTTLETTDTKTNETTDMETLSLVC